LTCGACWTFSTTGVLESQYAIKHGVLFDLAEQMLLDCDTIDQGCSGGLMTDAFEWLKSSNTALESVESYGNYQNQ